MDIRGVHRQPHEDGTYSSGLDEERTIKELKCGDKTYDVFKFFFQKFVLVRDDIVDDFGALLHEDTSYLC